MTSLGRRGYAINKDQLSSQELATIKKDLTVAPYVVMGGQPTHFKTFLESASKLYLPKAYGLKRFGPPLVNKLEERVEDITVEFAGALRPEQVGAVEAFMKAAKDSKQMGGILNMRCAAGKTVMAIYIICALKKKTIIIVHKDFLLKQWRERIEQFAPTARVGTIKAKILDYQDKDIVIASLQSLCLKEYDPRVFEGFGTLIADECFPYTQYISTYQGPMMIGDVYEAFTQGHRAIVASYNTTTRDYEYKYVTYAWKRPRNGKALVRITCSDGGGEHVTLECTEDHKILTAADGMQPAGHLDVGTLLVASNTHGVMMITELELVLTQDASYDYLYDIEVQHNHTFVCCGAKRNTSGVVVSNCHHLGAEVFSTALQKVTCQYTLGLSATVTRKDGLSKVFVSHLGDVVFKTKKIRDVIDVSIIPYDSDNDEYSKEHTMFNDKPNMSRMINNICAYEPRTEFIVEKILDVMREEPERRFLILSDRRSHLTAFKELLEKHSITDVGYYFGGMKPEDLKDSEGRKIILGTFQMACIADDTPVVDPITGKEYKLADCRRTTRVNFATFNEHKRIFTTNQPTCFGYSRAKPAYEIKHALGSITVSGDHKVRTCNGWVRADALTLHDILMTPGTLNIRGEKAIAGITPTSMYKYGLNIARHPWIPTSYMFLPVDLVAALVKGVLDAGSTRTLENEKEIRITVPHARTSNQLRTLLLRLGVPTIKTKHTIHITYIGVCKLNKLGMKIHTSPHVVDDVIIGTYSHQACFVRIESVTYIGMRDNLCDVTMPLGNLVLTDVLVHNSEGFDVPGLDTLVLASPKSDIIQSVGRILREKPENRRHTPLVIDIKDNFSLFPKQARKRQDYYKKCKYNIAGGVSETPTKQEEIPEAYAFVDE